MIGSCCREFGYCALIPAISMIVVQNSLPIIALDACHTKGKYKGMIMIAMAVTGQDKGFIIGNAISPTENEEYWLKFITHLNNALSLETVSKLVIIGERDKGLQRAIEFILPNSFHSYCIAHIEINIASRFRRSCHQIWSAAKVYSVSEYEHYI
ncbi:hypothetical protein ENBRE01_2194 [Enteropsectra breve]|nr:hypothetical protein ENBRE01_2194 [Enteropsectra breve]